MVKQINNFERAWRADRNKCEKSYGHFLLTKRTCKNIQEPTVCRIVLGSLNLKLCPETNTQVYPSSKKPANHSHKLMNELWFRARKDICTEMLCLPITVDVAILIRQRPVNLWKIARTKLTGFLFLQIYFSENVQADWEKKALFIIAWTWKINMGTQISLSNDPDTCQAAFL